MPEIITDSERHLAKEIAEKAMMMGWDNAIRIFQRDLNVSEIMIRNLLKKAADYNDKADPAGRIHELEDYKKEVQERSTLSQSAIRQNRAKGRGVSAPKFVPSRESSEKT